MSDSTARKVQPFTISTKLSLPKCSLDFPGESCQGISITALDNSGLHKNLNESVSLYLARSSPVPTGDGFKSTSPNEGSVTHEDRLNCNSLSRSIKKITLSNWQGEPGPGERHGMLGGSRHGSSERNCNNNNCRTGKAQFKVFLKKEGGIDEEKQEVRKLQAGSCSSAAAPLHMTADSAVSALWKEGVKNTQASEVVGLKLGTQSSPRLEDLCSKSPLTTQFNRDMLQAEKWVQGKLLDLKDGCSIQEWGRMAQTLQRDMKDFDNTMIKLNQMGEQLMIRPNHSMEISRRLQSLQEQWQLLKQMATNQNKPVGGLRSLQEFNQKAEQLEAWIRQKEEKPVLAVLLQENADKIQLTRRILDLKQEQQQFQALHEEINSLAHKLEKQGKSESRSIMVRRKHLNKRWLQVQAILKEHYETLQLALEVAAFLQQADVFLGAIHAKWRSLCGLEKLREAEPNLDLDVRDLASQVMMLDVTVSQLTSLHPSLVAWVSLKHQDVKESWAQLQQLLRNEKPPLLALRRRMIDSPSSDHEITASRSSPAGEKTVWKAHKNILESMAEHLRDQEGNSDSPRREDIASDNKRRRKLLRQANTSEDPPQPKKAHPQDFCQVADGKLQELLHTDHRWSPQIDNALEELEELWEELKRKHQENGAALKEIDTALKLVGELEEAECWLGTTVGLLSASRAKKKPDDLHGDLKKIGTLENQARAWSVKLRTLQEKMQVESSSEHTAMAMIQRKMERVKERFIYVQDALRRRASDLRDSLILIEFLQNVQLEEMLSQRNEKQGVPNKLGSQESLQFLIAQSGQQLSTEDMNRPLEELQEAVEMLNDVVKEREQANEARTHGESFPYFEQTFGDCKETGLAWIVFHMQTVRDRAEILAEDISQAERSFAMVKSEGDLLELERLLKRQKEIESDMSKLAKDMEKLENAVIQQQENYLLQISHESRRILEILESWKDLQKLVLQNAVHGQQAGHLRQFFRDYLAIISWTEDTRAQIFSESSSTHGLTEAQWKEIENNMEAKFKEFENLATAGWKLIAEEHFLSETIRERLEELQSMLGWVMVRWQAQSSQKDADNKKKVQESQDGIPNKTQVCQIKVASETCVSGADDTLNIRVAESPLLTPCSLNNGSAAQNYEREESSAILSTIDVIPMQKQSLKELENHVPAEIVIPKKTLILEASETPVLLVPSPGPSSLGGTVNLILSIGKKGEKEAPGNESRISPTLGQEALHKHPETKPSTCKTFWKRCQGFLGSLKRKKRLPRQHAEEVSTYLQMKEKDLDVVHESSVSMPRTISQMPPQTYSSPLPRPGWTTKATQTLTKASSSYFLQSLNQKGKGRAAGDAQLLTLQGIMGTELKDLQLGQEKKQSTSNTWPPKNRRTAQYLRTPRNLRNVTHYVHNPLVRAIDSDCDSIGETSEGHVLLGQKRGLSSPQLQTEKMNTCQHLSLGSVLNLQLPKDPTTLRNVQETIKVTKEGLAEKKCANHHCQLAQRSSDGAKIQEKITILQKRGLEGQSEIHQSARSKDKGSTWFEEMSANPSYSRHKAHIVAPCREDRPSPKSHSSTGDDFLDFKQIRLSRISVLHEQIDWEWDKLAASLGTTRSSSHVEAKDPTEQKASRMRMKSSPTKHSSKASYTTQVKTPLVNEMSEKENIQSSMESFVRITPTLPPLAIKSPSKLSVFEQQSIPASSKPGSLILTCRGNVTERPKSQNLEMCPPAHELFEEEEEELQAIWSNLEKQKRNTGTQSITGKKADKIQSPDNSNGKLILKSADNILVAKFKLPTPAQMLQSLEEGRGSSNGLDSKNSPSQCDWAPRPFFQEPSERVEASSIGSLQSTCQLEQRKLEDGDRNTGKNPSKLELQMMEGTLERKHLLQAGGKKANCRSWNSFHTVLMRQTLCFYQDKKDTLKSSAVAFPLNISGAVCTLDKEYTKKDNCFTLQMKDGSKYLLRALTEPLMKEWVIKLQQNSGVLDVDYFHSASQAAQEKTCSVSVIPGRGVSHFLGLQPPFASKNQDAVLLPRSRVKMQLPYGAQEDPAASETGNVHRSAGYTTDHSLRPCSPTESAKSKEPNFCQEEEDCGLVANKRRYSFTSATYQKISPLSVSKEPLGVGSSYSVTLYIGEQASAPSRPRCHSFVATAGTSQDLLGGSSQGASPRQKNKSVFRKFFGKKD
ncbi:spectrin beta chain, non-erythrocytic 1-like isoform X2 [Anolis sagrei]|uniref:spectrin beta chain, non-erythrocytic 1-like isoform X2 n=1 Tax=Anolis sagrei TaxID=38937 RepID=UPI0035202F46